MGEAGVRRDRPKSGRRDRECAQAAVPGCRADRRFPRRLKLQKLVRRLRASKPRNVAPVTRSENQRHLSDYHLSFRAPGMCKCESQGPEHQSSCTTVITASLTILLLVTHFE